VDRTDNKNAGHGGAVIDRLAILTLSAISYGNYLMTQDEFECFLYRSEGDALDFKREQYRFEKASDEEKSEFLKDILAFANSWRNEPAYIFIGVDENSPTPYACPGVSRLDHIDDAKLQQFVNSKTNVKVNFGYSVTDYNGASIGVIKIDRCDRPVYLNKRFGKLEADVVYVRCGSSTTQAKPSEIIKMVKANQDKTPVLDIVWYNACEDKELGDTDIADLRGICLDEQVPEYGIRMNGFVLASGLFVNKNYYKDVINYLNFTNARKPISLRVKNTGDIEAENIHIELEIPGSGISVCLPSDKPGPPTKESDMLEAASFRRVSVRDVFSITVLPKIIKAETSIDRLHAKRSVDFVDSMYFQGVSNDVVEIVCRLYCDGLPNPIVKTLKLNHSLLYSSISFADFKATLSAIDKSGPA